MRAATFWLLAVLALMWSDGRSAAVAPGARGRAVLPLLGHVVVEMVLIFAGVVVLVV